MNLSKWSFSRRVLSLLRVILWFAIFTPVQSSVVKDITEKAIKRLDKKFSNFGISFDPFGFLPHPPHPLMKAPKKLKRTPPTPLYTLYNHGQVDLYRYNPLKSGIEESIKKKHAENVFKEIEYALYPKKYSKKEKREKVLKYFYENQDDEGHVYGYYNIYDYKSPESKSKSKKPEYKKKTAPLSHYYYDPHKKDYTSLFLKDHIESSLRSTYGKRIPTITPSHFAHYNGDIYDNMINKLLLQQAMKYKPVVNFDTDLINGGHISHAGHSPNNFPHINQLSPEAFKKSVGGNLGKGSVLTVTSPLIGPVGPFQSLVTTPSLLLQHAFPSALASYKHSASYGGPVAAEGFFKAHLSTMNEKPKIKPSGTGVQEYSVKPSGVPSFGWKPVSSPFGTSTASEPSVVVTHEHFNLGKFNHGASSLPYGFQSAVPWHAIPKGPIPSGDGEYDVVYPEVVQGQEIPIQTLHIEGPSTSFSPYTLPHFFPVISSPPPKKPVASVKLFYEPLLKGPFKYEKLFENDCQSVPTNYKYQKPASLSTSDCIVLYENDFCKGKSIQVAGAVLDLKTIGFESSVSSFGQCDTNIQVNIQS